MYERTIKWKWFTIYRGKSKIYLYIYIKSDWEMHLYDYSKKNGSQIICLS